MTADEMSSQFDVLYDNVLKNPAPGLNEYEKSVFLTKAQTELVMNHFNPKGNKYQEGFDDSNKRQIDFSELITTASLSEGTITISTGVSIDTRAKFYLLPSNVLVIVNESAIIQDGAKQILTQIVPLHYENYTRLMSKAYKEPNKYQTWRFIAQGSSTNIIKSELIPKSNSTIIEYAVRYVRRPRPIILTNLDSSYGDVTIDGYSSPLSSTGDVCELNPIIHREILDRAVELAKAATEGDLKSIVQLNTRNE